MNLIATDAGTATAAAGMLFAAMFLGVAFIPDLVSAFVYGAYLAMSWMLRGLK